MTNTANKFLANQRNAVASGRPAWSRATGTALSNAPGAYGMKPQGWNANGAPTVAGIPCKPFVMICSNASASPVTNFSLLGANQFLFGNYGGASWSAGGNLTVSGITISMGYGSGNGQITYQQFLAQTMQKNFTVGAVYLQTLSGNNSQVSDGYTVQSVDGTGQNFGDSQIPFIAPDQFQPGIVTQNVNFNIDGNTTLVWNTFYASTVFRVVLWAAVIINPTAVLQGSNPQVVQGAPRPFGNLG